LRDLLLSRCQNRSEVEPELGRAEFSRYENLIVFGYMLAALIGSHLLPQEDLGRIVQARSEEEPSFANFYRVVDEMLEYWRFDFGNFQRQGELIERHLAPFASKIAEQAAEERDIVAQAILLWNCIHHTLDLYRQDHADWIFARHEDLSRDPLVRFRAIYRAFGLDLSSDIEAAILASSGTHNPAEQRTGTEFQRDARANVANWKRRLSKEEVARIRDGTAAIASRFYSDEDW